MLTLAQVEEIPEAVTELVTTAQGLVSALENFKLKTQHDVNLNLRLPPLVKTVPPLVIAAGVVTGTAFLISWIVRRGRIHKARM